MLKTPTALEQSGSILSNIGSTPLVRLARIAEDLPGIQIFGKAEYFNPGGSVKDRPAMNMILDGERTGKLDRQRTLLDSTSGNTGIAYAMIGAARGYRVKLCLPSNASLERKRILKAYGAEIVFTDPGEGSDGAIRKCREIYAADPDRYFYPDQYNNPANWKAHFETTGPEIIEQTGGRRRAIRLGLRQEPPAPDALSRQEAVVIADSVPPSLKYSKRGNPREAPTTSTAAAGSHHLLPRRSRSNARKRTPLRRILTRQFQKMR